MGGFCGGSSGSKSKRSAGRGSGANKTASQTVKSTISNISTDLQMGLSTFGMSKEDQAEKLSEMGYSSKAIDSYQARTAATAAKRATASTDYGDDDSPAQAATSVVTSPATIATTTTTDVPEPPAAPKPIGEDSSEPEAGSAEAEVVEGAKKRKGRASTIMTAPSGLLTTPKTRRRRSLMGGEELGGLIS
jgi:hypothetical protein